MTSGEVAQTICRLQQPILELLLHVQAHIVLITAELLIMSPVGQRVFSNDRCLLLRLVHQHTRCLFRENLRGNCGKLFLLLLADFLIGIYDLSEARFRMELLLG